MAPLEADREAYREAGKWSRGGVPREVPLEAAWQLTPEERRRRFDQAIEEGELFSILSLWADQGTDKQSNDYIAEMIRERIRDIVDDPDGGRDAVAARPRLRHQATVPRHGLLRHVQPPERAPRRPPQDADRADHRARRRDDRRDRRGRRPRLRHRLRRDDRRHRRRRHHRPRRGHAEGEVGARAAHLPRADVGRVPQPVPDHRPGQPVGAVEHGRLDRAARRLDRRPPRRDAPTPVSTRIEPTETARGRLGAARQRLRRHHPPPDGELVVHRCQRARQAAGVPAVHRRRRRLPRHLRRRRRPRPARVLARRHRWDAAQRRCRRSAAARREAGARDDGPARAPTAGVDCRRSTPGHS